MTQNREKMENTLDLDYKGIDKQFKEQLIKTKVCPIFLLLLLPSTFLVWNRGGQDADIRYLNSPIMIWRNTRRLWIMLF